MNLEPIVTAQAPGPGDFIFIDDNIVARLNGPFSALRKHAKDLSKELIGLESYTLTLTDAITSKDLSPARINTLKYLLEVQRLKVKSILLQIDSTKKDLEHSMNFVESWLKAMTNTTVKELAEHDWLCANALLEELAVLTDTAQQRISRSDYSVLVHHAFNKAHEGNHHFGITTQ